MCSSYQCCVTLKCECAYMSYTLRVLCDSVTKLANMAYENWRWRRNTNARTKRTNSVCYWVIENYAWYVCSTYKKIVPESVNKVLHHWSIAITYQTLSVKEIKASIECADALNGFNDDVLEQKINDLVNEAIRLELPDFDEKVLNVCDSWNVSW